MFVIEVGEVDRYVFHGKLLGDLSGQCNFLGGVHGSGGGDGEHAVAADHVGGNGQQGRRVDAAGQGDDKAVQAGELRTEAADRVEVRGRGHPVIVHFRPPGGGKGGKSLFIFPRLFFVVAREQRGYTSLR